MRLGLRNQAVARVLVGGKRRKHLNWLREALRTRFLLKGLVLARELLWILEPEESVGPLAPRHKRLRILSLAVHLIQRNEPVIAEGLRVMARAGLEGQLLDEGELHGLFEAVVNVALVLVGREVLLDGVHLVLLHNFGT